MSGSATFRYLDTVIQVAADELPLAWLEHFLRPWFADGGPATPGSVRQVARSVSLVFDPRRHEMLRRGAAESTENVPCFVLDTRVISHPLLGVVDGRRWIDDRELNVVYGVAEGSVEIVARADEPGSRVALMRVVRELALIDARRVGDVVLHCAAVAQDGAAIAFCGPKKAGKTSLMLHSLAAGSATFVANDRAVARIAAGRKVMLCGMPTIVALRADTLGRFPALADRVRSAPDRHWLTPMENERREARPWRDNERAVDLAPQALVRLLGVRARAAAPLSVIVFPTVDESVTGIEIDSLQPSDALDRLRGSLVGAAPDTVPPSALDPAADQWSHGAIDCHERTLERLSNIRSVAMRIGRDAFAREWSSQHLLGQAA